MINIDTRLIPEINEKELWFLIQVVRRINYQRLCWPSNATLLKDTGWHIEKLQAVKKSLVTKGIIEILTRGDKSNVYTIKTEFMGVYINARGQFQEDSESLFSDDGKTDTPVKTDSLGVGKTDRMYTGKTDNEVLTREVLTIEVGTGSKVAEEVLKYFNLIRSRHGFKGELKHTIGRIKAINSRVKEGFKLNDFRGVIEHRFYLWSKDDRMSEYLTPETIFRPANFAKYVEAANNRPQKEWTELRPATDNLAGGGNTSQAW